jgi:hypothetical protein
LLIRKDNTFYYEWPNDTASFLGTQILIQSHPQADLPTRSSASYPVLAPMHVSHRRHCCYLIAPKLSQLVSTGTVDIDETIHVSNTEALDVGLRILLPLGTETFFDLMLTII